ncbi:MAG: hypothetical protein N3A54_02265 [Patescibacteria group bacterium]|nr:hypothetical protein [Patescibacteria group bacterium]
MSRTIRRLDPPMNQEDFEECREMGFFKTYENYKKFLSLHYTDRTTRRLPPKALRKKLNRDYRAKVNKLVRKFMREDVWDKTAIPKQKKDLRWLWF